MKVRWLGNSCVEIFGEKHILIDPNFTVKPEKKADIVLVTHEHDDHFDMDDYREFGSDAELLAPEATLNKFDLDGDAVEPGIYIKNIKVLDCDCWKAEESVSYYFEGVLHSGDSAEFPDIDDVKLLFTACFEDYYDDYISAFKRLEPDTVVPFHYDPEDNRDDAEGLMELMDEEGLNGMLMEPGDSIEI